MLKLLVLAFISCHLELTFQWHGLMTCLQSVQNAVVHLVLGAQWYDHIPPVLHQLHWLPVRKWVGEFQDSHLALPFVVWHGSGLPGARYSIIRRTIQALQGRFEDHTDGVQLQHHSHRI